MENAENIKVEMRPVDGGKPDKTTIGHLKRKWLYEDKEDPTWVFSVLSLLIKQQTVTVQGIEYKTFENICKTY